jgi:DNA-binding HxlR family transcriptional regulator/putative sterol carrier protein
MVRAYEQYCGLAKALDVVGERWTLLLVRDLYIGPQRYSDLLEGLPGIGSGLLAQRLQHLEAEGVVRRAQLPPPAASTVYELTPDGRELAEATLPLALWGARRLGPSDAAGTVRADWLFLSIRAQFKPERAADVHETYEFHVDGRVVHVRVDDGALDVRRGASAMEPDLRITTDALTLFDLGLGRLSPTDAFGTGRATIEGSAEAAQHCFAILGPATDGPESASTNRG